MRRREPRCAVREGPEELTLRAEEVGTQKAFCQAIHKGIEGEDWKELYHCYKEMNRAAGVRKPHETQKAKAIWKMKAAKDGRDDFYDPDRKDNILVRNKTRLELGRAPQGPDRGTGQSSESVWRIRARGFSARKCMRPGSWMMLPRGLLSLHEMPSLPVARADSLGEGCGERKQK